MLCIDSWIRLNLRKLFLFLLLKYANIKNLNLVNKQKVNLLWVAWTCWVDRTTAWGRSLEGSTRRDTCTRCTGSCRRNTWSSPSCLPPLKSWQTSWERTLTEFCASRSSRWSDGRTVCCEVRISRAGTTKESCLEKILKN